MKQWLAIILIFITLNGCQTEKNYDYFMQHPDVLAKAVTECKSNQETYCEEVNRAREDFSDLIDERAENPELFGLKIMRIQEQRSDLLKEYQKANQSGDTVQIKKTKHAYQETESKIKILYAVIVAMSQEVS